METKGADMNCEDREDEGPVRCEACNGVILLAGGCGCGEYPGEDWIEEAARLAAETGATISCGCDDCMAARYDSGHNTPAGGCADTPTEAGAGTNA